MSFCLGLDFLILVLRVIIIVSRLVYCVLDCAVGVHPRLEFLALLAVKLLLAILAMILMLA